jgi:signal transduction histidine kinase
VQQDAVLEALDEATRAIAGELDLDRVLQLTVDRVRTLVDARYAALGIVDRSGRIERFITSGISSARRARIGPPPRGHGLLGTIIRDGVSLRLPDIKEHPDSYGFPPNHPPMRSFLGVPVRVGGRPIGNFYLTEKRAAPQFSERDLELAELFALHAGIAIQNARLHRQVQDLILIDERLRISRDLHDGIVQGLYGVALSLEDVPDLIDEDRVEAVARVDRAIDRLNVAIQEIRAFIMGLGAGADSSLAQGVLEAAAELPRERGLQLDLDIAAAAGIDAKVTPETSHELVQIIREALSNVARHSGAAGVRIAVLEDTDAAVVEVTDDGRGFDVAQRASPGHFGLVNLRDRAAALGGELRIESRPGGGTTVMVRIPLPHAPGAAV